MLVWERQQPHILSPQPSQSLRNHSPDDFEWGYGGSGPAQLALAILLDFTGDEELSLRHYQAFKERHIATLKRNTTWTISGSQIEAFLRSRQEDPAQQENPALHKDEVCLEL